MQFSLEDLPSLNIQIPLWTRNGKRDLFKNGEMTKLENAPDHREQLMSQAEKDEFAQAIEEHSSRLSLRKR